MFIIVSFLFLISCQVAVNTFLGNNAIVLHQTPYFGGIDFLEVTSLRFKIPLLNPETSLFGLYWTWEKIFHKKHCWDVRL